MKPFLMTLAIAAVISASVHAETIIEIKVSHTNGADKIYLNNHDAREYTLENVIKKLSAIDRSVSVSVEIAPDVAATSVLNILRIIRDSGMKGVTITPQEAAYNLAIEFASQTNAFEQSLQQTIDESLERESAIPDTQNRSIVIRNTPLHAIAPMTPEEREYYGQDSRNRSGKVLLMPAP